MTIETHLIATTDPCRSTDNMTKNLDVSGRPALSHRQAMDLQEVELRRTLTALGSLDPQDWQRATDCPAWDVRAMYQHVLGACEAGASIHENMHQMRAAMAYRRRHGGPLEAALSATQVSERAALSPTEIVARLGDVAPRAVKGRRRTPALMRRLSLKVDGPVVERWRLGYLIDTIYLRDLWLHRVDLCRATGHQMELTAEHDGVIVADVVTEWARRHGKPVELTLTGPAGSTYRSGAASEEIGPLDAVEFCRALAGRIDAPALPFDTKVPF